MRRFPEPRKWTLEEIKAEAEIARAIYAERRPPEGREAFRVAHAEALEEVRRLLDVSDQLRTFSGLLVEHPGLLDASRFLAAPFFSQDDLATVSGHGKTSTAAAAMEARTEVLSEGLDVDRFPWLAAGRPATQDELEIAIRTTAVLVATQRAGTVLRNMWARRQEAAVAAVLEANRYKRAARRRIMAITDLPSGQFCPESNVFGKNADVPVGLRNSRYLLMECKVSNSEVNSYKRLNHECVNKREIWFKGFGDQAYTAAVLSGVFKPSDVLSAQEAGHVFIYWEHNLEPLAAYLTEIG